MYIFFPNRLLTLDAGFGIEMGMWNLLKIIFKCLGPVHWDDPEGWDGEGGGRGVQDAEHM